MDRPVSLTRRRVAEAVLLLTLFYALQGAVLGHYAIVNRRLAREGRQAHEALCTTRENLSGRISATRRFLEGGGRIPGVPDELLLSGLRRDEATLRALSALRCE